MSNLINLSHAKKLRVLRKSSDLRQSEIAEALNISQQAYSKLEKGETSFTDSTIEKIATFFDITPAEFENLLEGVYIGNNNINTNNSNTAENTSNVDLKLVDSLQKSFEQTTALFELLIKEKDVRIAYLEALIENK